jgi:hypothetical protein
MTEIIQSSGGRILIRYASAEVHARGMIEPPDTVEAGLGIDAHGNVGHLVALMHGYLCDVTVVTEEGVQRWPDGVYEIAANRLERLGDLVEERHFQMAQAQIPVPDDD